MADLIAAAGVLATVLVGYLSREYLVRIFLKSLNDETLIRFARSHHGYSKYLRSITEFIDYSIFKDIPQRPNVPLTDDTLISISFERIEADEKLVPGQHLITLPAIAAEIFQTENSIIISGRPGAGKSRALARLAKMSLAHRLVIFITSNEITHPHTIAQQLDKSFSSPLKEALIARGLVTIFVDGLNEVKAEIKSSFELELFDLIRRWHLTQFVVTTRQGEIPKSALTVPRNSLLIVRAVPLSRTQAEEYFKNHLPTMNNAWRESWDRVVDICNTPLLCWMTVAALTQGSRPEVIRNRADIYREFLSQMEVRDHDMLPEPTAQHALVKDALREFSWHLANKEAAVTRQDAERFILSYCSRHRGEISSDATSRNHFFNLFLQSSCLTRLYVGAGERIGFFHQTVQEYLVAVELYDRLSMRNITVADVTNHLDGTEQSWWETIIFLAEIATGLDSQGNPRIPYPFPAPFHDEDLVGRLLYAISEWTCLGDRRARSASIHLAVRVCIAANTGNPEHYDFLFLFCISSFKYGKIFNVSLMQALKILLDY